MPPSLHTLHEYIHSAMFSHHRATSLLAGHDLHPVLDLGLYLILDLGLYISSLYTSSLDLGLYISSLYISSLDLGLYISSPYISSLDLGLYLHPVLDLDLHTSMFFLDSDLKYIQGLLLVPTMIERLSDFYTRLGV